MKEYPILFNGEMVRAVLKEEKTQTRRPVTPQPKWGNRPSLSDDGTWALLSEIGWGGDFACKEIGRCPYGMPGDHLWVRETFVLEDTDEFPTDGRPHREAEEPGEFGQLLVPHYRVTEPEPHIVPLDLSDSYDDRTRWCASIHMPRWASRILLENTAVRVQRVQDIPCADVEAEGIRYNPMEQVSYRNDCYQRLRDFAWTWDSIYAKPKPVYRDKQIVHYVSYPWEAGTETREHRGLPWFVYGNPWVWALDFRELRGDVRGAGE